MKISDEEVELGARALREVVGNRSGFGKPWEALPAPVKQQYREEALAVLSSIRQRTGSASL